MNAPAAVNTEQSCPRVEIAAYIDGELTPREELVLEEHLASCQVCRQELNEQKKLLCALDFALEEKTPAIKIPQNFAKIVATHAESGVSGSRNRDERRRALFLCAALCFIILLGLGAEAERLLAAASAILRQIIVIATFIAHTAYDVAFGIVVILRPLANQTSVNLFLIAALLLGFLFLSVKAFPRILSRLYRT